MVRAITSAGFCLITVTAALFAAVLARHPARLSPPTPHDGPARNLLLYPPGVAEYYLATNAPSTVGGVVSIGENRIKNGTISALFPQIIPLVSQNNFRTPHAVNLEVAMSLHPDHIFMMGWLGRPLAAIGLPVVPVRGATTPDAVMRVAALYNNAAGEKERQGLQAYRFRASLSQLRDELGATTSRPRILDVVMMPGGTVRVQSAASMNQWLIDTAGARSATNPVFPTSVLSAEHILALRPDVILYTSQSGPVGAAATAASMPWALFPAARSRQIYAWPAGIGGSTASIVEGPLYLRWLAEILHPEKLKPSLRETIRNSLRTELGATADQNMLDEMLSMQLNSGAADIQRFSREEHDR